MRRFSLLAAAIFRVACSSPPSSATAPKGEE
jgi:hypothetical protein